MSSQFNKNIKYREKGAGRASISSSESSSSYWFELTTGKRTSLTSVGSRK